MSLTLLIGPARSGKSSIAVDTGRSWRGPVTFIATAEGRDDEMRQRIRDHRTERPAAWSTIEEPLELAAALLDVPAEALVILDCLTLWISNLLETGRRDTEIEAATKEVAGIAQRRGNPVVVVTNEVGAGIVPAVELARVYQDVLGRTNRIFADAAAHVFLVTAGRALALQRAEEVIDVAR